MVSFINLVEHQESFFFVSVMSEDYFLIETEMGQVFFYTIC